MITDFVSPRSLIYRYGFNDRTIHRMTRGARWSEDQAGTCESNIREADSSDSMAKHDESMDNEVLVIL